MKLDMPLQPTNLKLMDDDHLLIEWSDGQKRLYKVAELRKFSPDALTREKHRTEAERPPTELPILQPNEIEPVRITAMNPVGNYAYQIVFSDGHDTGIYTFEYLQELGQECE